MFFLLLVRCAVKNQSMESVCDEVCESSDRFFHYLGRISVEQVTAYCNVLLKRAFKIWWRDRAHHRPVFLAIDMTDLAHDGQVTEYVHYTVKKRGLKHSKIKIVRYATISIVLHGFRLTLGITPVRKKEKLETIVERLIREIPRELRVRAVLMDKEFYQSRVLKTIDEHGLAYVVPIKQYDTMNVYYHIAELTGVWRSKYTINEGESDSYQINVYMEDEGIDSYIGFASNLDMNGRDFFTLVKAYRYRWNAEIGYKDCKDYRVKTRTRNHAYRVLSYTISHIVMCLHNLVRKKNKTMITLDQMRQIFLLILTLEHGTQRLTKRLIVDY
ncbi:MAG: Transposase DDE domain protein [Methanocella sp. PtaU1.Bin125]|nr:MAG: Transposase DDE domain protein [Methanocella sp. PtaU1.Bin125]